MVVEYKQVHKWNYCRNTWVESVSETKTVSSVWVVLNITKILSPSVKGLVVKGHDLLFEDSDG